MTRSTTSDWFRRFADLEAAGSSPIYERLARAIADHPPTLARLDPLPRRERQPNLVLAACQWLGAPLGDPPAVLEFIGDRWDDITAVVRARSTQTNEPARTAAFLPILATLPQPIALVEIGASAGLCLYPDRYRVSYDDRPPVGPAGSPVSIDVTTNGRVPTVDEPPDVVWRAGLDINPLDAGDPDDLAWLAACIWPEHIERRDRLYAAAGLAAEERPHLVRGDALDDLDGLLDAAPDDATLVVFHSAALIYLVPERRQAIADRLIARRVVWLSNEVTGVVTDERAPVEPLEPGAHFVLARDGAGVAVSHPHGRWLAWA